MARLNRLARQPVLHAFPWAGGGVEGAEQDFQPLKNDW